MSTVRTDRTPGKIPQRTYDAFISYSHAADSRLAPALQRGLLHPADMLDDGPGLPEVVRANLFRPFVTTKNNGMGVGLSICHSIVETHGGRLWAEDNPGGGTVFRFTLPRAPAGDAVTRM